MSSVPPLSVSEADRDRIASVEALASRADVGALVDRLDERSWTVRRAVVAALARLGASAVGPLVATLRDRRDSEARVAATADALVALRADPTAALLAEAPAAPPPLLCDLAMVLGRRRSRSAAPVIAGWVRHPDDNVAVAAIEALGRIGADVELPTVVEAAESGRFFRVFPAIDVLSRTSDPLALGPLERLLADPQWAAEAARALGRRGELDAVPALGRLLGDRADARVRLAAAALAEIGDRQAERFGTAEAAADAVARAVPDPDGTARRLQAALLGADPAERRAIGRLLGWLRAPGSAAALVDLLDDEQPVATAAAGALFELGRQGSRAVLQALRDGDSARRALLLPFVPARAEVAADVAACLSDPDPAVRARACEVLLRAAAVSAVPALFGVLGDADPRVSQAAVAAIQGLGHEDTQALAIAAARSDQPRVRRAALRVLGYFGWDAGLQALLAATADRDERLRDAAIAGLALVADARAREALVGFASAPDARVRAAAMRALGQRTADAAPDVLAAVDRGIDDPDPWVRYYACQALGRMAAPGAIPRLVGRLRDDAGQVRIAVVDALATLDGPEAEAALLEASRSPDPDLRRAALLGLGTARVAAGVPAILAALAEGDPGTRVIALSALAGFQGQEVHQALVDAARGADPVLRRAALGALAARPGSASTAALVDLLRDEGSRREVLDALAIHVVGRIPGLLAALESAGAEEATLLVAALARMGRPDARAALGVALAMDPVHARRAAASALAALGGEAARPLLEEAARRDPDPHVRRLATQILTRR